MVEKTKQELAYLKVNPKPPQSRMSGSRGNQLPDDDSDDNYSDDGFEANANEDDEKKVESIRKAMTREATKAAKIVSKITPASAKKDPRALLKVGPSTGPAMDMD